MKISVLTNVCDKQAAPSLRINTMYHSPTTEQCSYSFTSIYSLFNAADIQLQEYSLI